MIGILMLLLKSMSQENDQRPFYMSGYGEVSPQFPNMNAPVEFNLTLTNSSNHSYKIKAIEPIFSKEVKALLHDKSIMFLEQKRLNKNSELDFVGQFQMDTSDYSEKGIEKLRPFISNVRIIYDNDKEIILNTLNISR
ncbi:hypothetical protein [Paenibacillus pini]|nr:hypothetical protein [Paenibacillus pini]